MLFSQKHVEAPLESAYIIVEDSLTFRGLISIIHKYIAGIGALSAPICYLQ